MRVASAEWLALGDLEADFVWRRAVRRIGERGVGLRGVFVPGSVWTPRMLRLGGRI